MNSKADDFKKSIKCKRGNHCDGRKYEITNISVKNINSFWLCPPPLIRLAYSRTKTVDFKPAIVCGDERKISILNSLCCVQLLHSLHEWLLSMENFQTVKCTLIKNVLLNSFSEEKIQIIWNEKKRRKQTRRKSFHKEFPLIRGKVHKYCISSIWSHFLQFQNSWTFPAKFSV